MSSAATPATADAPSAIRTASASPRAPVAALACPLLTTTAVPRPAAIRPRVSVTGAATTRFVVNRPATVVPGAPTSRPRSAAPLGFTPALTPAARNPAGKVTPALTGAPP